MQGVSMEVWNIFISSFRDGFVQVSAFVAITVLLFSYIQYRTGGRVIRFLESHRRFQPIAGALLGLTPGCGGAIVAMPLYMRGTVSFGTVVATLATTAGDSAFVIIALAPEAALWSYAMAFVAGVAFGYMIDVFGMGTAHIDRAVENIKMATSGVGFGTKSVAAEGPSIPAVMTTSVVHSGPSVGAAAGSSSGGGGPSIPDLGTADHHGHPHGGGTGTSPILSKISHAVLVAWWVVGFAGLIAGLMYLVRGAPEVEFAFAPTFSGLFTVTGLAGTTLSFYNHFIGRYHIGEGNVGRIRDSFSSAYDTLKHAAMETSMVTIWVIAGYLIYEYVMFIFALDIQAIAQAGGILVPLAGAALGLVPGCTPQIVFASVYANGALPFSALTANAISQDGDALFPLMAIDMKAAILATVYTTIPAIIVGILLYYFWPFASYGFGVL